MIYVLWLHTRPSNGLEDLITCQVPTHNEALLEQDGTVEFPVLLIFQHHNLFPSNAKEYKGTLLWLLAESTKIQKLACVFDTNLLAWSYMMY